MRAAAASIVAYSRSAEASVMVSASPRQLFDVLDDQARLGGHMEKPSMMMLGGSMHYEFDAAHGREVGSLIKMKGGFLGLRLSLEEVIVERTPPQRKVWETRGLPQLIIIGAYRMGFEVEPLGNGSSLRVFIAYDLPKPGVGRMLGFFFAPLYARWCVDAMAHDARRSFPANRAIQML